MVCTYRLSPAALGLFLRAYHSPRPIYRVGPDLEAAVEELLAKGVVCDVPAMGPQGEGVVLMVCGWPIDS